MKLYDNNLVLQLNTFHCFYLTENKIYIIQAKILNVYYAVDVPNHHGIAKAHKGVIMKKYAIYNTLY